MRWISILGAAILAGMNFVSVGHCQDKPASSNPSPTTFAIETYVGRAYNYLDNMVDKDGLPVLQHLLDRSGRGRPRLARLRRRDEPPVAGGDHGPAPDRQGGPQRKGLDEEGAVATSIPKTGLLMRPKTSLLASRWPILGDQALTLYALVTAYADRKIPPFGTAIDKMVDHLPSTTADWLGLHRQEPDDLGAADRLQAGALEQAGKLVRCAFDENSAVHARQHVPTWGHMHGNLRTLVGAADYALYVKDPVLFSRVDALYRYVRSKGTRFGFLPEVMDRKGDVVSCETCALMDFVGLAVDAGQQRPSRVLGRRGADGAGTSWWRARSPMVPGSSREASPTPSSSPGGTWGREWSAATRAGVRPRISWPPEKGLHWGGPELRGKTRAIQNCCGGSGTHAFFIVWKNASRFENGTLSVNLHIDKLLPQAEIRCFQPYQGLLTIDLKQACKVRVRIPEFVDAERDQGQVRPRRSQGEGLGKLPGTWRSKGRREAGSHLSAADAGGRDRPSATRFPAVPLPRDVERRHGRPHDAHR